MADDMTPAVSALVSPAALRGMLDDPRLRVLDATYGMPHAAEGIPGAADFDIDDIADPEAPLAHTVPAPDLFAKKVSALGVGNGDTVVVYDSRGIAFAAARAWWMFRLFGHGDVRVLDGGLPAWAAEGYPLVPKKSSPAPAVFTPSFRPELLRQRDDMRANLTNPAFAVLDARDTLRFSGHGHIPGSLNLPWAALVDAPTGKLKSPGALRETMEGLDLRQPLACSCGSGVTACVIALALHELGHGDAAVYDGSWTEWGADPACPKATGDAA